jgi:hypothetical protein
MQLMALAGRAWLQVWSVVTRDGLIQGCRWKEATAKAQQRGGWANWHDLGLASGRA